MRSPCRRPGRGVRVRRGARVAPALHPRSIRGPQHLELLCAVSARRRTPRGTSCRTRSSPRSHWSTAAPWPPWIATSHASRRSTTSCPEPTPVKFGVIRFPGSCDEIDAVLACERVPGASATLLWHGDKDLQGVEAVVVPGGFSYGDYLRVGAIARFSPVMESVIAFSREGGLVLGICNGFQVLCEAGPAAGRAAAERRPAVHLPPGRPRGRACRDAVHGRLRRRRAAVDPGEAHDRPLLRATGGSGAPRRTRADRPAVRARAQPQRLARTTSPACATRPATSSGSCRTPSTPSTR